MAAILTIFAGFIGFLVAVLAMVIFHANPLTALALWSAIGFSATLLALAWMAIPRRLSAMIRA